jgi:hypothetical protein
MKIHPTVRPLPYYTVSGSIEYALLAKELRFEFKPKVSRRLPMHHLCGFRHDTIVRFVSQMTQLIALQRKQLKILERVFI